MTDRELLELAAKAAGISGSWFEDCNHMIREFVFDRMFGIKTKAGLWNPLTDDGDALRLAVELRIDVNHDEVGMKSFVYARTVFNDETHIGLSEIFDDESERLDRTRRAITRAAAQIGKDMQ